MAKSTYKGEKSVNPNAALVERLKKELKTYYTKLQVDPTLIESKIEKVITKACYGWKNCPSEFESRVRNLKGHNSNLSKKIIKTKKDKQDVKKLIAQKKQDKEQEKEQNVDMTFVEHLNLDLSEKKFLKNRKLAYFNDFDFNSSSDEMALNKIVLDEFRLKKLEEKSFKNLEDEEYGGKVEDLIDSVQKRLQVNITALGISRKARIETDQNIEGNIAQLSFTLEQKLDEINDLDDKELRDAIMEEMLNDVVGVTREELQQYVNEIHFQKLHEAFPEKNPIPESILLEEEAQRALTEMS